MIAPDSKSYPFLAIAQRYNAPYALVLRWADHAEQGRLLASAHGQFGPELWHAVVAAVVTERRRRDGAAP